MLTTAEIAILLKFSPKREQMLDLMKHISLKDGEPIDESKVNKISNLSTTIWTVRAHYFQRIIDNYQYLYNIWDKSLKETGLATKVKSRIIGCKAQMTTFILWTETRKITLFSH